MTKTFADLGVDPALLESLAARDVIAPFPIQELTLPLALGGADVIGQARTGTGKTLAFGLPLLQRLDPHRRGVQALVITPTRELCLQVATDLTWASARTETQVAAVYGGMDIAEQEQRLRAGVHVVVGTPGRLLDHVRRRTLKLGNVRTLVLDEADEMLDLGFLPDVERIVGECPPDRQTMLFSATMPKEIVALARRYMTQPTFIRAEVEQPQVAPETQQFFFLVHRLDKPRVLARILQSPGRGLACVFVRTKAMADRLVEELDGLGVPAAAVHGDLRQASRERNLAKFRGGTVDVLVATEVAARGLDIDGLTHVVNYDCPDDDKMYLHRIGRTGRAGASGVAITFAQHNEADKVNVIRKAVGAAGQPLAEIFSTSPALTELFGLPEETAWGHLSRGRRAAPVAVVAAVTAVTAAPELIVTDDEADDEPVLVVSASADGDAGRRSRRRRGERRHRGGTAVLDDATTRAPSARSADIEAAPPVAAEREAGAEPTSRTRSRTVTRSPVGASRSTSPRTSASARPPRTAGTRSSSTRTSSRGEVESKSRDHDPRPPEIVRSPPGEAARGPGQPTRTRRVAIEELP